MAEGIEVRVAKDGTRTYRASVWSNRDGKLIRKSFPREAEAKSWRADAAGAVRLGRMRAGKADDRRPGRGRVARGRGGRVGPQPFRRPVQAERDPRLRKELDKRILPAFGSRRLTDLTRGELQDFVDRLGKQGMSASSVQCSLLPLRAIYRRAIQRGDAQVNPCAGLDLPAVRGGRDRIADPAEAAALLAALPEAERAVWATAMYAGLRRGELRALRWENVDLATGVLRVEHGWDDVRGRDRAEEPRGAPHRARRGRVARRAARAPDARGPRATGSCSATATGPFVTTRSRKRAAKAWKAAGLEPITLHECRHTFASLMIAAGVNAKALEPYMGHATITITLDLYGHLMPGNEDEAAGLLDAYLTRADTAARLAQLDAD